MAMGVCGVVLTAIGSTLDQIAINCGTTSTAIGTVFLARGAGAILGAVLSAKIYAPPTKGNMVMMYTMVALTVLLMYIPFIDNVAVLHFVFAGLGFCTAVTDTGEFRGRGGHNRIMFLFSTRRHPRSRPPNPATPHPTPTLLTPPHPTSGCQIMTRKTQGVQAGPWLGANTVVFGEFGAQSTVGSHLRLRLRLRAPLSALRSPPLPLHPLTHPPAQHFTTSQASRARSCRWWT